MRLEGTLDAFSLPDIFQLLSYTKKTGTLHLRRDGLHGVVHVRDGAVTGGRGDVARQALGRRLVGAGLVDDEALADAAEQVLDNPALGLGKTLVASGKVDPLAARELASEQAADAVFELLRWPNGEFAFVMDEADPDDVGATLPVEEVVAEANRRLTAWQGLEDSVPSLAAVVSVVAAPAAEPAFSREEWALLALVNGTRTVSDLVALAGTGEFVVVAALAALAERGLVQVGGTVAADPHAQRQQLLAALEGRPAPDAEAPLAPAAVPAPEAAAAPVRQTVIPERPEPFTPTRRPDHAEPIAPAFQRYAATAQASSPPAPASSGLGAVQGAHALAPESAPSSYIDRDPSVNKSLLLRLIAGVRGL
ncbi:MAG TPA: DUF4388 domain-containing protein [Mycobacteriales bacterium]|nr:DUF4388 domain-containing protein [Mycobacteriales bacterium]